MVSIGWFVSMAALAALAWCAGCRLGQSTRGSVAGLLGGVIVLAAWAYLARNPAVAVQVFSARVLSYIEGVASVPIFMFIIGIVWALSQVPRQKRVAAWASVLGIVYFMQGGMWLLQSTPQIGFADAPAGEVRQSQEYSCVPAAAATALNMLGVYTSEATMAELTQTRPGTGATTIRALYGLEQRLEGTKYRVELIAAEPSEVTRIQTPALTPLQYETTRKHMVVIIEANRYGVWVSDPMDGPLLMDWDEFERVFTGQLLVFRDDDNPHPRRLVLPRFFAN